MSEAKEDEKELIISSETKDNVVISNDVRNEEVVVVTSEAKESTEEDINTKESAKESTATESANESKEQSCDALHVIGSGVVTSVSTVGDSLLVPLGQETLSGVSAALNAIYQPFKPFTDMFSWNASVSLPARKLGSQGLVVPPQGLGCMGMTAFYIDANPATLEETNQETIAKALELGLNFFDTAWIYQSFGKGGFPNQTNEDLLGRAIAKHGRSKFIIATKFGIAPTPEGKIRPDSSEAVMRAQLADSLARLQTDYIDLYYQHRPDPNTPIEDVVRVLKSFVEEGKVRYIGLSECSAETVRRAHAVHPISALQMEYSLQTRDIESNEILATARELGIGIVAYSPLGRGLLTAKITSLDQLDANDWRRTNPRWQAENFAKNTQVENSRFQEIATKKQCTAGQLALAWLHAQGDDIFPIPGTKSASRLMENIGAVSVTLTPEEAAEIASVVPQAEGARYAV